MEKRKNKRRKGKIMKQHENRRQNSEMKDPSRKQSATSSHGRSRKRKRYSGHLGKSDFERSWDTGGKETNQKLGGSKTGEQEKIKNQQSLSGEK